MTNKNNIVGSQIANGNSKITKSKNNNKIDIKKMRTESIIISFIVGFLASLIASYIFEAYLK